MTAALWTGWHRRAGRPWQEVCSATTEGECWDALLDLMRGGGDLAVLPAGQDPRHPPTGARMLRHRPRKSLTVEPLEPPE
jgi:hypothetical protein